MGDGFEVDPEGILAVSGTLRDGATALDEAGGGIPEADAGVMTQVIENAVGALLSNAALLSGALLAVADSTEVSALGYHATDARSSEEMVRLMMPGARPGEIAGAVERVQRADEIELAQLLMPGDPEAAEQAVLDSPSQWDEAQDRQDAESEERAEHLRDLWAVPPPPGD